MTRRPTESDSHLIILNDPKYVSTRVDSVFLELARDSVSTPLNNEKGGAERATRTEQDRRVIVERGRVSIIARGGVQ